MTDADIYRLAAKLVESGGPERLAEDSCCWAIVLVKNPDIAMLDNYDEHSRALKQVFRPKGGGGFWLNGLGTNDEERRNGRILALCFMAAMAEAGDVIVSATGSPIK